MGLNARDPWSSREVKVRTLATLFVLIALAAPSPAATKRKSIAAAVVAIDQVMTPAQFKAAGLDKLTPKELEALNQWVTQFVTSFISPSVSGAGPSGEVIETYIEGDFEGWSGETIFKLDNGQIWQQASYSYTYSYAYRPKVMIYRSGGEYKMKVEGVGEALAVKRLK
jgi:hypothetical protein